MLQQPSAPKVNYGHRASLNCKIHLRNTASEDDVDERLRRYDHLTDVLHAAILRYTNTANMDVVARILNLPRELRDNIYMQLWQPGEKRDPTRSVICWWELFHEPWFSVDHDPDTPAGLSMLYMNLRPPHFIDRSFVGSVLAKEALKLFRDIVGKDLRPIDDEDPVSECLLLDTSVADFVRKDVFGVGFTMEELVRNLDLRVTFQCDALTDIEFYEIQKSKTLDQGSLTTDATAYTREDYLSEINDGVTALLGISHTERVTTHNEHCRHMQTRARVVTLAIRQEEDFGPTWDDPPRFLKLVARAYHGLRAKGFTVKVQYYSEEIELKVLFEDDVWEWTSNDWEENLIRKNTFPGLADGNSPQRYVWAQLQDHVFRHPDNDSLTM